MAKGPDPSDDAADAVSDDAIKGSARFDHRPLSLPTDPIDS